MSSRKSSSSSVREKKHAVESGMKMFNFVGSLMVSALEKKQKANNELSHSEKAIMEILGNQLNQTQLDKNSLKSLVKELRSQKGKRKIKSSKRGGAYRRQRSSSPVRSVPRRSPAFELPRRHSNVNDDPIILDLEKKQYYSEVALVGVVLMTICYGIISIL